MCVQSSEIKNSQKSQPYSYAPAIAHRDEINMSADRDYLKEPCLKMISVHNN